MRREATAKMFVRDEPVRPTSPESAFTVTEPPASLDDHLVSLLAPASYEADQYRTLRHLVERLRKESNLQALAVTSPGPSEGKTLTTLNLAGALAQNRDARVLVIDADLRRPNVAATLRLANADSSGLADLIRDPGRALADGVRHLQWANLFVLPAGISRDGFYELLTSSRLGALVEEAQRLFDYVLIDTPPVISLPDCRLMGRWVHGFLVVVAAGKTPPAQLTEALAQLEPEKVIGLIFNGARRSASSYYGYYGPYHSKRA
jgi:protein-tyrosine kinase